jgi:hypothetical protein
MMINIELEESAEKLLQRRGVDGQCHVVSDAQETPACFFGSPVML